MVLSLAMAQGESAPSQVAHPPSVPARHEESRVERPPRSFDLIQPVAQARQDLADAGIQFNINLTIDAGCNFTGGTKSGGYVSGLLTATLAIDTERLVQLKGGSFVTTWQSYYETNPGPYALVPDWWGYEGLATGFGDDNQLSQCFYSQSLFDEALAVTFGKQDCCNNFLAPLGGNNSFIHTMSYYPAGMLPYVPSYPDQAMGLVVTGEPAKWLDLKAGWFDGTSAYSPNGAPPHSPGSLGPGTFFDNPGSWFFIAEADLSWTLSGGLDGTFGVGGWWQTGPSVANGNNVPSPLAVSDGVGGFYIQGTQRIFNPEPEAVHAGGLQLFGQFGWSDPSANPVQWSMVGGLEYIGPIPGRPDDEVGLALGYASFSDSAAVYQGTPGLYEMAIEAYYDIAITPWMALQPDIQFVTTPSGQSEAPTAVIAILRLSINF